jgi:hypothetical protein
MTIDFASFSRCPKSSVQAILELGRIAASRVQQESGYEPYRREASEEASFGFMERAPTSSTCTSSEWMGYSSSVST